MSIDWEKLADEQPVLGAISGGLRDVARIRAFADGQRLCRCGQPPKNMMYVLSGEIRLVRHSPSGAEVVLQRSRGGFIAEASLDAHAYHCDVIGATTGRLLLFPRTAFQAALEHDPAFNRAWILLLSREVRQLRTRCERLSLHSAADRILHYIEAEGDGGAVTLTQSRKAWASELGLSHEVVYRTLRQLREAGILSIDGRKIARSHRAR